MSADDETPVVERKHLLEVADKLDESVTE